MKENDDKKKIRRFRRRLNIEAGIRAGTIGLASGLTGAAVVLLYARLRYRALWMMEAGIVALVLFAVIALFSYWFWLRPRKKEVLMRIDALGLKERIITMEELKQQDTVMAKRQRQDATEHLAKLNVSRMKLQLHIKPMLFCLGAAVAIVLLVLLPFPEQKTDEQAGQNALEMVIVDEMIVALKAIVEQSEVNTMHKEELYEIVDALAVSFTPEDSTLTRTAKIATASKRLDMHLAAEQSEVALLKQQSNGSDTAETQIEEAEKEYKMLSSTIKQMKDIMGTSIDVLNKVEGTFWTPGAPSAGTSYDVESLPEEESAEGEEPQDGEESGEGEEPQDGELTGEGGEPQEGMEGDGNGSGTQIIFDPEQGEVGYGSVYEEYYQEILKALTEREFSEEIREIIEDYANSLE